MFCQPSYEYSGGRLLEAFAPDGTGDRDGKGVRSEGVGPSAPPSPIVSFAGHNRVKWVANQTLTPPVPCFLDGLSPRQSSSNANIVALINTSAICAANGWDWRRTASSRVIYTLTNLLTMVSDFI